MKMFPDAVMIIQEVKNLGGDIVFEWPSGNWYWNLAITKQMCAKFGLMAVPINGCALGLRGRRKAFYISHGL